MVYLHLMSKKLSEELSWRGFVNQTTFDDIKAIDNGPLTFYFGVDPSASSMTIGNLAAIMMVKHFIAAGHKAVLLVGGATGLIGDPDGKAEERALKTKEEIDSNKHAIVEQYKKLLEGQPFEVVDNYDWFKDFGYLEFLRTVGKHVPMRQMLGREFVQERLREGGSGISYAEFSYVLIQAYDFVYLNKNHGVTLQLCGSDQWGNSIAGVDLIRRVNGQEAHVWSTPLVINKATGQKFGKTEGGAVWLEPKQTSIYEFYQFWLNVDDDGVADYLKVYTMLEQEEIEKTLTDFRASPAGRLAQRTLAYEVTKLVHGQPSAEAVVKLTAALFGGAGLADLSTDDIELLKDGLPNVDFNGDLPAMMVESGLAASKSEARTFIGSGAVSLNGAKVTSEELTDIKQGVNLLKRGKNSFAIVNKK
jgi:tyrosyl-tRNA synthetase